MEIGTKNFNLICHYNFSFWKRYSFPIAALLVILLLSYSNSFDCSWHFDDGPNITQNAKIQIQNFSWDNIKKISYGLKDSQVSRPVSYLSFAANHYFHGLNVFGYHIINFLIHLFSSVFLFLFIFNTLKLPLLKRKYQNHAYSISLLATIFWAIHPIHVTAVTYIVQRMASMAGLFYIASMYFYLKFRTSETSLKYGHAFFCIGFATLAIGTKENAAMLPVSIFLYDLFFIQGLTWDNIRKNTKIVIITVIILIGIVLLLSDLSSIFSTSGYTNRPFTMVERLFTEPRVILFYISLLFYPVTSRLTLVHDIEISKGLLDPWTTLASILVIVFLVVLSLMKSKRWPLLAYCILFFFINHFIEGSFIPLELIYEHRNYIPSMLFFVPIAVGLIASMEYFRSRKTIFFLMATTITIIMTVLSVTVYMQNNIMKSEMSLWYDNVKKSPHLYNVRENYGIALFASGLYPEALEQFKISLDSFVTNDIRLNRTTYKRVGECYFVMGNDDKAIEWFYKSIVNFQPAIYMAHSFDRLAEIFMKKGNLDKAEKMAIEAIAIDPSKAKYYQTYSSILLKTNRPNEAIDQSKIALRLNPSLFLSYLHIAEAFNIKGKKHAEEHFRKVANVMARNQLIESLKK